MCEHNLYIPFRVGRSDTSEGGWLNRLSPVLSCLLEEQWKKHRSG